MKIDPLNDTTFDPSNQLCLASADSVQSSWTCQSRRVEYDSVNKKATFDVPRDGIYAIIFNPRPPLTLPAEPTCKGYIC